MINTFCFAFKSIPNALSKQSQWFRQEGKGQLCPRVSFHQAWDPNWSKMRHAKEAGNRKRVVPLETQFIHEAL